MKNKFLKWFAVIVGVCIIGTSGVTLFNNIKDKVNEKDDKDAEETTAQVCVIDL